MHDAVFNLKYRGDGDFDLNYLFQGSNEICDKLIDKQFKVID